jgi:WD40 repeat protein
LATIEPSPNNELGDTVTFWDIPTLKPIRSVSIPDMSLYIPIVRTFSPSGDQFAVLVSNSTVKIFSTTTNQFSVIQDSFASIADIAITPEGEIRAVSCSGTTVKILSPPSEHPIAQWDFDEPTCGQLLEDATTVAVPGCYATTRFYRVGEAKSPATVGHGCCRAFSNDGHVGITSGRIASSGEPVTVAIWQTRFGLYSKWKFYDAGTDAFNVAVSPSGQYAAATSPFQTYLWVHGIESGRQYPELRSQMAFSPNEKYLASTSGIIDLATGQITFTELEDDLRYYPYYSAPAFSPDGQILAAEIDGTLRFWQLNNGALLIKLDDPDFSNDKMIFSPDGTFLVGLGEGFVNVWGISETVR